MAAIVDASTFPLLPISPPIATLSGLAVTERDVFVCSWPKSGTTWMQAIVAHLVAPDRSAWSHVSEVTPFYDAAASWDGAAPAAHLRAAFAARGRRAWNTHVPWSLMPKGARYVYVVRDQRDALVSFWHHLRNQRGDAGTYEGASPASGVSGERTREPGLCRGPRHASPRARRFRGGSEAVARCNARDVASREIFSRGRPGGLRRRERRRSREPLRRARPRPHPPRRDALAAMAPRDEPRETTKRAGPLGAFAADSVANTEPYGSWAAHVPRRRLGRRGTHGTRASLGRGLVPRRRRRVGARGSLRRHEDGPPRGRRTSGVLRGRGAC